MAFCPNCSELIPKKLSIEGGNCPRCTELILPMEDFELDNSDTQEVFPPDDITDIQERPPEPPPGMHFDEYDATELISHAKIPHKGMVLDEDYQEDFPDYDFIQEDEYVPTLQQNHLSKARVSWRTVGLLALLTIIFCWLFLTSSQTESVQKSTVVREKRPTFKQNTIRERTPEKVEEEIVEETPKVVQTPKKKVYASIPAKLERNLGKKVDKIADCVDQQRLQNPKFQVSFRYSFTITKEGSVPENSISVSVDNTQLKNCVSRKIKRFRFPEKILEGKSHKIRKKWEE